jgi:brefeldin A-resistance guanine nucleotide exchange factor 1
VSDIVSAGTNCRCEVTDTSSDEVVILGILQLLQGVAACEAGALLTDAAVCEIVHACFRICSQPSLSELLRHSAEASLRCIVDSVFTRLPVLPHDRLMPPGGTEMAAAGAAAGDAEGIAQHIRPHEPNQAGAGDAASGPGDPGEPKSTGGLAEPCGGSLSPRADPSGAAADGDKPQGAGGDADHKADAPHPPSVSGDAADATAGLPSGHRTALTEPGGGGEDAARGAGVAGAGGSTGGAGGRSEATSGARDDAETGGEGAPSSAGPYGGACLFEVLRFFLGLLDGSNPNIAKGPAVREFGLSLLLAALRAGGLPLGRTPPFSSLLEDELCLALIRSAEAEAVPPGAAAVRESAALGLTLQCAAEV